MRPWWRCCLDSLPYPRLYAVAIRWRRVSSLDSWVLDKPEILQPRDEKPKKSRPKKHYFLFSNHVTTTTTSTRPLLLNNNTNNNRRLLNILPIVTSFKIHIAIQICSSE